MFSLMFRAVWYSDKINPKEYSTKVLKKMAYEFRCL